MLESFSYLRHNGTELGSNAKELDTMETPIAYDYILPSKTNSSRPFFPRQHSSPYYTTVTDSGNDKYEEMCFSPGRLGPNHLSNISPIDYSG